MDGDRSWSRSKWIGLVAAVWIQAISGNNYTFSNYSDALKSLMHLTQVELNNLSVAKDVGKAFGLLAGLASDKFPTWIILLIGSVEGLVGYGVQWLVVSQRIQPLPYYQVTTTYSFITHHEHFNFLKLHILNSQKFMQMCIFLCVGGNSTTWMNTAVLVTCIRNFRRNRGPVSGILKGYVGLSTAIFTNLCYALFADDPASFLLMLALIPFVVCLSGIFFLREIPPDAVIQDDEEPTYFGVFNAVAVVVAVYLLAFSFVPNPSLLASRAFSIGLLVLLAAPLGIPVHSYLKARGLDMFKPDLERQGEEPLLRGNDKGNECEVERGNVLAEEEEAVAVEKRRPAVGEEHTVCEALRTVDFWILFVSFLCGVGTGLAVMNNMGQIGLALGYSDVSLFVSLTSIWGFFGRIVSGSLSEYFIK